MNAATLAVAIVGAVTGLAALTAQVWQTAVSGPRVKVSVTNAVTTETWRLWLSIDLTNVGRLPVTVSDVGVMVEVPGKEWQKMPYAAMQAAWRSGDELPYRLIDGESVTFLLEPAVVTLGLEEEGARMDVRCYAKLARQDAVLVAAEADGCGRTRGVERNAWRGTGLSATERHESRQSDRRHGGT